MLLTLVSCTPQPTTESPIDIKLYQNWELQPGDIIAGHKVTGSLGDISIALKGGKVYAPYEGRLQPHKPGCVMFSSSDVPNYLLRLCGLKTPNFGLRKAGEALGSSDNLEFAVLNKRPDSKWALVEPSKQLLEQMLQAP
ncbi:MAG TPA: hypothetical protein DDZ80_10465 [Cyanobacteria bacterium UBA8803]|nr:hypothetical protein [Cyanobacteria bacterium UBA9273]HBL58914.1 hypothetical protein [Cyanobacteria bacterium UBA8803]